MSDDGSDVDMHSAVSHQVSTCQTSHSPILNLPKSDVTRTPPIQEDEPVATWLSFDLMHRIPGMYRLLDLVQERGSGGGVDQIIIAQDSIAHFSNTVHPGSYRSDIQVDFKTLDQHIIRPRGIYGSPSAIVNFLGTIGLLDDKETRGWLLCPRDEYSGVTTPTLRPGLYLVKPANDYTGLVYIVFWPEDATWQDGAISSVSRNRVTFMRYLSKLCDQIDCLLSDEHASQLVWKGDNDDYVDDRMYGYTVTQTNEEEEGAHAEEGFLIRHHSIEFVDQTPSGFPPNRSLDVLQPRLIPGETRQGILETRYIAKTVKVDETLKTLDFQDILSTAQSPIITLNPRMDRMSLEVLLEHGIWEQCGNLKAEWTARTAWEAIKREEDRKMERIRRRKTTARDRSELDFGMVFWLTKQAAKLYPIIPELTLFQSVLPHYVDVEAGQSETAIAKVDSWLEKHSNLSRKIIKDDYFHNLETNPQARYNMLKRQLQDILQPLGKDHLDLSPEDIQRLANLVTAIEELKTEITKLLRWKIKALSESLPAALERGLHDEIDEKIRVEFERRREKEEEDAWKSLRVQVAQSLAKTTKRNGPTLDIDSLRRESSKHYNHHPETFHIKGTLSTPTGAGFEYIIRPIDVKADDMHAISGNPSHICKPVVRKHSTQAIPLPVTADVRFIQLIEKDQAFVIIEEPNSFKVYIDSVDLLASAICQRHPKKTFMSEKLGGKPLFALDEARRLFVILRRIRSSVILYVYTYDLDTKSLNARGSAENLIRWYSRVPEVTQLLFVPGTEELLLVEKGGLCRIFSLVAANFRPSTLQLKGDPENAFFSSDGACLFVKIMGRHAPRLLCYHLASFGSNEGTEIPWPNQVPADAPIVVSSVGHRQSTHIVFMARQEGFCQSLCVRITSKSSEYVFHSNFNNNGLPNHSVNTTHNSLIDCHAEMWTRFPVSAAIVKTSVMDALHQPRSILFVSKAPSNSIASYFDAIIQDFEYNTRKPTGNVLKDIKIVVARDWKSASTSIANSEFQTGDWLVGLFCLIPIHLAVARSNRFIPLKDGVDSPQFQHSLLGAQVAQISEALSFGWYESIFSSYLASKPVKVVTSMGEQSVGKSFTLNHFVDTSFAGSAMRRTKGVWLSVTPTKEYLVVALNFEGIHSAERSAQEDTFLVLLNAAISNFVLFHNNFAMSRDITGLFNSFQSCTKVLDPASNPSLFHSTLGIIIKDVIASDTKEIVNEFQQKFQRIVQKERADNFISQLHRGRLDIIPWPVIESARFYDLFNGLKKRLDRQPITHKHAGAFLGVLKTLMAKLKTNDWGPLDQNLAIQRAQQLSSLLPAALAFGTTDPVNEEPLKNYDTDEDEQIGKNDGGIFFVENVSHPINGPLSLNSCLEQLRKGWEDRKDRYSPSMSERKFVDGCNDYLRGLAEARISRAQTWIDANTSRFGDKAEVTALRRSFDQLSKDLRASVVLCGSKCTFCGLLCLEHKQHDGDHTCNTNHKCPEICGFTEQHEEDVGCDLPAGHIGRHVCSGTPHLCGMQCDMYGRNGCLIACTKSMDHDESDGHQCAAGMHTCGELCSLVPDDGYRLCSRLCTLDCRIAHEQHQCDRSLYCPIKCQLCNSYCAAGDHFHALEPGAIHLCGQKHNCKQECELEGVCEIKTTPQSIKSTFVGKDATFQYTKYSQQGGKLPCIIPIAPGQLEHDGRHIHSNDRDPFHYCTERCKNCGYYCTLPLGHVQPEHSTNHGSMAETQWFVGDKDPALVLQGRKYTTGDSSAPMLCSLLCETQGRHVHIDACRPDENGQCIGADLEHINRPGEHLDWITHRLFWARSGFKDPYSREKQYEFGLCDHRCGGPEHDGDENTAAVPSFCTLPIFHGTPDPADIPPLGHVSHEGHVYSCKNPALMQ